jgi:hypothetical protein
MEGIMDKDRIVAQLSAIIAIVALAPFALAQDPAQLRPNVQGDDEYEQQVAARLSALPQMVDGHFKLPPMAAPDISLQQVGNGRVPDGFRGGESPPEMRLPEEPRQRGQAWDLSICSWTAPNTYSRPRYFEDRMLERHGHERWGHLQPLAAGARFFATVPMLPYLMTVRNPCDCEYTLGYYRSGSCAPIMMQRPPLDTAAVIVESAAIAGVIVGFP